MFSAEVLQAFFTSTGGKISVIITACIILMVFTGGLYKNKKLSVKSLTYSAIAITLALILSQFKLLRMPQGGSITPFSMLFIVLIGYWFGPLSGILAGVTHGLLQLVIDPYVIHPLQLLMDYPFAFGALGLSGFFRKDPNNLVYGMFAGAFGRFLFSFLSGYIFFGMYTPEGFNPVAYSAAYNIAYIGGEMFLTMLILMVPAFRSAIQQVRQSAAQ